MVKSSAVNSTTNSADPERVAERLQLATRAAGIAIWDWDVVKDELVWDDAMYRLFRIRKEDFSGAYDAWAKTLAPEDFERLTYEVQAALRGEREYDTEFRIIWPDGSIRYIKANGQTFRDDQGRPVRMIGVNYDITERKLAEEQINLLHAITLDVTASRDLPSALEVVLRRVCDKTGWALGQAWIPRQDGTGLDCCPSWFAADEKLEEFISYSRRITILPGRGLPGRVLSSRQPVWIPDVTNDPNFPRVDAARKSGLKAALGVPIVSGDEIIAVLEFFLSEPREEDERLVKVISAVAAQIGLVCERKLAEQKLVYEKELLETTINSMPGIFYLFTSEGRYLRWNKNHEEVSGYTAEEMTQRHPLDFFVLDEKQFITDRIGAVLVTGNATAEAKFVSKDGHATPYFFTGQRILLDGEPCVIGMGIDITERKRAEEALRESERRFSDTLTNVEMIAVMADMKGGITFCNDYLLRLTGWKREEVIGRNWYEMFLPDAEKAKVSELLDGVQPEGEILLHMENEIKTRTGERRLVKWTNVTLRGPHGEVIGVAALGDDITERKAAEEQLRSSTARLRALSGRLQSAREEEGKRIARAIHDELGSALTGLKWDIETVDKILADSSGENQIQRAQQKFPAITKSIEETINIVRRVASELRPGVLDDLGLVAAIEWQAQQFEHRTGITCTFVAPWDNIDLSQEHATTIFRVFQEILTNVLRHAHATKLDVKMSKDAELFELEVRDNGRGITEAEKSNTRSLGLLGMRERVQLIGGDIQIDGVTGLGTVVVVKVPTQ